MSHTHKHTYDDIKNTQVQLLEIDMWKSANETRTANAQQYRTALFSMEYKGKSIETDKRRAMAIESVYYSKLSLYRSKKA